MRSRCAWSSGKRSMLSPLNAAVDSGVMVRGVERRSGRSDELDMGVVIRTPSRGSTCWAGGCCVSELRVGSFAGIDAVVRIRRQRLLGIAADGHHPLDG